MYLKIIKYRIIILIACIILPITLDLDYFATHRLTVTEMKDFESNFFSNIGETSINYSISSELCPPASDKELAQPLLFKRPETSLPTLEIKYYYTPSDSLVHCATYDVASFDYIKEEILNSYYSNTRLVTAFNEYFNVMESVLSQTITTPVRIDEKPILKNSEVGEYWSRNAVWENEETNIRLFMILGSNTRRIRVVQYWK